MRLLGSEANVAARPAVPRAINPCRILTPINVNNKLLMSIINDYGCVIIPASTNPQRRVYREITRSYAAFGSVRCTTRLATSSGLSARTEIFLYIKILSAFTDWQPSLLTTLLNKKDMLTGAFYSKFEPRNSQLTP